MGIRWPCMLLAAAAGERGGDERFDDYFGGIGAEDAMGDGEFGGGPWSGEGPYAHGGGGY